MTSVLGAAIIITVATVVSVTTDSKGNVTGEIKEYPIDLSSKYYIDDIKFADGVSAEIAERADGLLCAQSVREHLCIDSRYMSLWEVNDFVNNMNGKLKNGKLGDKLDIKVNGGLFYHTYKDSSGNECNPKWSNENKILFDKTSAMWNKVLTADDGTLCYNKDNGKAFSFEMVPLGSANADEVITKEIKNNRPVIALVDFAKIDPFPVSDKVDLCYCIIYGIIEKFDKSNNLIEKEYKVFIPRKDYSFKYSDEIPVKRFISDCVIIDPSLGRGVSNWDYSKYGCWYEKYNIDNFHMGHDLSGGHEGWLGTGTGEPGYYIFVKTK